jgi:WD40 repeat protein
MPATKPASLAFSPDGKRLVTGGMDRAVWVWDVASGRLVRALSAGKAHWPTSVAFTPDGARVTAAVREPEVTSCNRPPARSGLSRWPGAADSHFSSQFTEA